jgi:hypothetical protein
MNASRPEASDEYSTTARRPSPPGDRPTRLPWAPLCLGIGGALALLVAQFTPLLRIMTVARHPVLVRTVQTGPHHGWALVPVAVLALWVSALTRRIENRAALGAIALLGLATLAVALLVDLPDVWTPGIVGTPADGLRTAQAHAGIGLYLETLAAALMLLAAAVGILLSGAADPVAPDRARRRRATSSSMRQPPRNTSPTDRA